MAKSKRSKGKKKGSAYYVVRVMTSEETDVAGPYFKESEAGAACDTLNASLSRRPGRYRNGVLKYKVEER